ncbi:MAG: cobalt-precorrin-7 (C(5))-methyltransferase [Fibrobacterota bacterium]
MTGVVHLVGCGPGGAEWVLPYAHRVVTDSDIVFGPSDLQALFPEAKGPRMDLPSQPETAAPLVLAALDKGLDCAVLLRGDCGLHSLAKGLQARLPAGVCHRVPGLSSVQVACATFGLDWERARIRSAHGRELEALDESDSSCPLVVILGGGPEFAPKLERMRAGLGTRRVHLASDLTLSGQWLRTVAEHEPIPTDLSSRTIALFEKVAP